MAARIPHEISDYLEKPVVTVCRTDRRSDKAARLLAQRGFADVHVITNGMTGWNENGYPLAET
jgi:rhodanese-related sulfurtransferase